MQHDLCSRKSNEIKTKWDHVCASTEEGREAERIGEGRREPKRAEERKSIRIQRESDKPEQCIVQTHSITQSHVEALTNTDTHAQTTWEEHTHTYVHLDASQAP